MIGHAFYLVGVAFWVVAILFGLTLAIFATIAACKGIHGWFEGRPWMRDVLKPVFVAFAMIVINMMWRHV